MNPPLMSQNPGENANRMFHLKESYRIWIFVWENRNIRSQQYVMCKVEVVV